MKMFTLVSIIAATAIATAQTEPAATTTTQETTTTTAPVEAKKVEKKKKAKKAKPAAKNTELNGSTTVTANDTAVAPAASTLGTTATASSATISTTANTTAAGTSTATAAAATAAKPALSGAVTVFPQASYHSNNLVVWTSPAISYKVNDKLNVGIKHTFETLNNFNDNATKSAGMEENNFRSAFTDFKVGSSLAGIMGSNELPVSLAYRNVTSETINAYVGAYGMIEANLSIPYTINSKVDVGVDTQIRHVLNINGANSNRMLAIPNASYAFNDKVSVYQAAGYILSLGDNNEMRRRFERMYLETGVNLTPIKNLSIGINVNQDKAISASEKSGVTVTDFTIYNPQAAASGDTLDSVAYEAMITYKF
jgi:hypothetical protein